ncbi:MAG: amino acid adenylation domain-containing protein, partial [Ruminococcus sp.]|nr:amino acid adenylation domain-containing protein [Ruminococcus sp.]
MGINNNSFKLTIPQTNIVNVQQFYEDTGVSNLCGALFFKEKFDDDYLTMILNKVIKNNDAMRIRIINNNGNNEQVFCDYEKKSFESYSFDTYDEFVSFIRNENTKPAVIFNTDLFRFLICTIDGKSALCGILSHIISDGWSFGLIISEVLSYINNETVDRSSYKDFIQYESEYIGSSAYQKDFEYWNQVFNNVPQRSLIKPEMNDAENIDTHEMVKFIPSDLVNDIQVFCKEKNITETVFFQSLMMLYLAKINSNNNEIIIGAPILNRNSKKQRNTVGMFVSTIPVKKTFSQDESIIDFMKSLGSINYKNLQHRRYPFDLIIEDLHNKFDYDEMLFDVMVSFQDNRMVTDDYRSYGIPWSENPLFLNVEVRGSKEYTAQLIYQLEIINDYEAELLFERLMFVASQIITNSECTIGELDIIPEFEKNKILNEFNPCSKVSKIYHTAIEMFEAQADKNPDNIAVSFKNQNLTFDELNAKANALAHMLIKMGVGTDDFVALVADRSIEMLVGILGVLKAGGAYVPIDPTYPDERINYILEDCQPKVLLIYATESEINIDTNILMLDLKNKDCYSNNNQNPEIISKSDNLAYVIYTSGTTGKPKGVMIENRGLSGLIKSYQETFEITSEDKMLQYASYCFDQSVGDIFGTLCNGGAIYIASTDMRYNIADLEKYMSEQQITVTSLTPKVVRELSPEKLPSLRLIDSGGEAGELPTLKKWARLGKKVINSYGPTETTVNASYAFVTENTDKLYIGKPAFHTDIYIVDDNRLCGIGIAGELCISGDGVARGYLNRPELTAEKFIDNPFGKGKLYHSGDLARWTEDGNIEYLGRIDEQVKIRGFRIELGEVENHLRQIESVKDCSVVARTDKGGDKALYAYFTSNDKIDVSDVRDKLSMTLPEYMIPSYMMQIEEIPVTKNGKIDKKALPEITDKIKRDFIAPQTKTEIFVCDIFCEILGLEKVSVNDRFFEIGGHSLRATRLVNSIEAKIGVKIALKDVFAHSTPKQLAKIIENKSVDEPYTAIPKAEEKEFYPMTSVQRRTYLIQQMEPDAVTYNMSCCMKLVGEVHSERFKNALQKVVDRHEILRTAFLNIDGELVQKVLPYVEADYSYIDESNLSDRDIYAQFVRPFDLSKAKNIRLCLVNRTDYYLLMIDMHHIVSDGMSEKTLTEELIMFYNGQTPEPLTHQFKDYSEWMNGRDLSSQRDYWLDEFGGEIPVLDMPYDYQRPQRQSYKGKTITFDLGSKLSESINMLANETGATAYMIFLSALMIMLSKYSRQDDIIIGSPISGRTHKDTEKMLGMFVNTLAMRGRPEGNKKYSDFLEEVKRSCLKAYENQEYPFEELVENVDVSRDLSRNPLFDVLLVLQNNDDVDLIFPEFTISSCNLDMDVAKFDLTFDIAIINNDYRITFQYCTDLYADKSAELILKHFVEVLKYVTDSFDSQIKEIPMISGEEVKLYDEKFNNTGLSYSDTVTINSLFEEQVIKHYDKTALIIDSKFVTYGELDKQSDAIAAILKKYDVNANDFVALLTDRSIEMISGLLGIVKAGGAYVPIDPTYPLQRINYILNDSKPKAILKYCVAENIEIDTDIPVINLADNNIYDNKAEKVNVQAKPDNLMYCIYTSGTTGNPKGVMVEQKTIVNLINCQRQEMPENCFSNTIFSTTICFDVATQEIFSTLLNGGTGCIINNDIKLNFAKFAEVCNNSKINTLFATPSYFDLLSDDKENINIILSNLEYVILAGEAFYINSEFINNQLAKEVMLYNHYGPTETHVVTTNCCKVEDMLKNSINIGKPISNTKIVILDEGDKVCGIGVPGELCVTGIPLARGYCNQDKLTSEKFINNPFGEGKLYRTGDLARWLPNGEIDCLGRIDEQVKIRGFRIELGEIESCIKQVDDVKDSAVIVRTDSSGDKAIYAYYTADKEIKVSEIHNRLIEKLPAYMLPAYMMQIDVIPLTKNGKLDKRALPDIKVKTTKEYVAPRTETEKVFCEIFGEILGVEKVGINDGFFELG